MVSYTYLKTAKWFRFIYQGYSLSHVVKMWHFQNFHKTNESDRISFWLNVFLSTFKLSSNGSVLLQSYFKEWNIDKHTW